MDSRRRDALIALILTAALGAVSGCGGGNSATTGGGVSVADTRRAEIAAAREAAEFRDEYTGAELVSRKRGWARTHGGLYWTDDGGRRWREVTPPGDPGAINGVYFRNPRQGWAGAEEGSEGENHVVLFATEDGGHSWRRTPIEVEGLATIAAGVGFTALGQRRVFALVAQSTDTASSVGHLFTSGDGGRRWYQLPDPPHDGTMSFESPRNGWFAAGGHLPGLYRTHDGGRTWTEIEVSPPPGVPAEDATFGPPQIDADGDGLLPVIFRAPAAVTAALYRTRDRGRHWEPASHYRMRLGGDVAVSEHLFRRGRETAVVADYARPPYTLLGPGQRHSTLRAAGLPPCARLSFAGRFGFALVHANSLTRLFFTTDGGTDWKLTSHPRSEQR
jgi:photosystem II stability/assembly factor-like uncharacterized protein